jgi:hypothetical protein
MLLFRATGFMKYDIAESYADVQALLGVLAGAHRQRRSDYRANVITGVLVGAMVIWAAFVGWEEAENASERLGAMALALFGVGFPLALWIGGLTEYAFTPHSIEQRNPLWRSWTLAAADVHRVTVEFTNQWVMIITANTGQTRRFPIVESMSVALGTLYPSVFGPSQPLRLPKRLGYIMYTMLAVVILAFVILVIVLYRRGLLEW